MLKRTVFADSEFAREAQRFVLLKVDLTDQSAPPSADVITMFRKYDPRTDGGMPLPTVLFIDSKGKELRGLRTVGVRPSADFIDEFVAKMKLVS
jgi:thiol:disulfide interchange protein